MALLNLPDTLLYIIHKNIQPPYNHHFGLTCKHLLRFIECNVTLDLQTGFSDFYNKCISLYPNTITVKCLDDPQLWLPYYPDKIIFDNCTTFVLDPPEKVYTRELILKDYNRNIHKTPLYINWDKFPELIRAELCVYDVNKCDKEYIDIKYDTLVE